MNEENATHVEVMMRRFRDEIARNNAETVAFFFRDWASTTSRIPRKDVYAVTDFTRFDGEGFVRNAYLGLLRREPDESGLKHHLWLLRAGKLSKLELLQAIRSSAEGARVAVFVEGLGYSSDRKRHKPRAKPSEGAHSPLEEKTEYAVGDLLGAEGEDFVRNAYLRILKRQPDAGGLEHHVTALRSGTRLPVDILGSLRFSEEGRSVGVRIRGLSWRFNASRARRIPLIRQLTAICRFVLDLPRELRALKSSVEWLTSQSSTFEQFAALSGRTEQLKAANEWLGNRFAFYAPRDAITRIEERLDQVDDKLESLRIGLLDSKLEKASLESHVRVTHETFDAEIADIRADAIALRRELLDQQRITGQLRGPQPHAGEIGAVARQPDASGHVPANDHSLDSFYIALEDRFRGARRDIKARVGEYLPLVRDTGAGTLDTFVIDVGCGRGEWLEVLKENDLIARGVDLNFAAVEICRGIGLEAVQGDGIEFLRDMQSDSVGAVTAFHLIEHLLFGDLIRLFDEVLRVLRPGGLAIFETPNPENLTVGACTFYDDPTHLRPLPPELVQFIAHARGYARTEIRRLHPFPPEAQLTTGDPPLRDALNATLFSARDYALIAYK